MTPVRFQFMAWQGNSYTYISAGSRGSWMSSRYKCMRLNMHVLTSW